MLKDKVQAEFSFSWVYPAVFAFLLFAIAYFWMKPNVEPQFHGILFSRLSENPFDFKQSNPVQFRILSPLIAYLIGLRGTLFYLFPWGMMILFMFALQRVHQFGALAFYTAFIKAMLLSFSFPLFLNLAGPGYVDSMSWLLILICLIPGLNRYLFSFLLLLSLLNQESSVFAFPGILYWRHRNDEGSAGIIKALKEFLPSLIVYSIFRMYLSYQAPIKYDWDYYLNANNISGNIHSNFPNLLKGTFFAFRLAWIIPVWALIQSAIRKQYKITIALVLMLLVPFFQLFIAYDISRLLCLCFPSVLVGFDYLFKEKPRQTVIVCIIIILVNLILPVCIVGKDGLMRIV
ncbi:MAG: hypothetical protein IPO39_18660 [Bacteroidetes bacterium]|nr:hypothetical protein [Bacteroidota bacterium]